MKLWCTKNLPVIDLQMPVVSKEYWYSQHLVTFEELQHKLAQCLTTVTCTFQKAQLFFFTGQNLAASHRNLLETKAITTSFLVQQPICNQFYLVTSSNLQQLVANSSQNKHFPSKRNHSVSLMS